jgi:hypothetical protein
MTIGANASILDAYDFGRFRTIVDVAGRERDADRGRARRPSEPSAASSSTSRTSSPAPNPCCVAAGVLDRCEVVAGSFFESVPRGRDAYVLKWIIHDWEDEEAWRSSGTCRAAMASEAGRPRSSSVTSGRRTRTPSPRLPI